jgi:hypothetical protein
VVVEHRSLPWTTEEFRSMVEWDLSSHCGITACSLCRDSKHIIGERARSPQCGCIKCENSSAKEMYLATTFSDYEKIDPKVTKELSDHQYMLCASHLFGFVLKDRTYGELESFPMYEEGTLIVVDILDISGLSNPRLAQNALDQLVLRPDRIKHTIKAIVQTYSDSQNQSELFSADFIHGKGEGQIFLLHGPPGTGKTLTAGRDVIHSLVLTANLV